MAWISWSVWHTGRGVGVQVLHDFDLACEPKWFRESGHCGDQAIEDGYGGRLTVTGAPQIVYVKASANIQPRVTCGPLWKFTTSIDDVE